MLRRAFDPSSVFGWLAFVVPLAVYAISLPSGATFAEPGELQSVPYLLGIVHPTGDPLFVCMGYLVAHALPVSTVAWRMGLMSAVAMALAARAVFAAVVILDGAEPSALGAAWLFAFGEIAWTRGTRPEPHAFLVCALALSVVCALALRRGDRHAALPLAGALAAALATHPAALLALPALGVLVVARRVRVARGTLAAAVVVVACGLAAYAYVPLRQAALARTGDGARSALGLPPDTLTLGGLPIASALGTLVSPRIPTSFTASFVPALLRESGFIAILGAVAGLVFLARSDGRIALGLALAALGPALPGLGAADEFDPERYFLTAYAVVAILAGVGCEWAARALVRRRSRLTGFAGGGILLAATILLIEQNAPVAAALRGDTIGERWIGEVRRETPEGAVIVAAASLAAPLVYAGRVERRLGTRAILDGSVRDYVTHFARWHARGRGIYLCGSDATLATTRARFAPARRGSYCRPYQGVR